MVDTVEKSLVSLGDLGIDFDATFDRLLSPSGIINQFALTAVIRIIWTITWIISGIIFASLKDTYTSGPIFEQIQRWDVLFSWQVC